MSERFCEPGESSKQRRPVFGDIITCRGHNHGQPSVVIGTDPSGDVAAFAIIDDENHEYGIPGSVSSDEIADIIDHVDLKEVAEMLARRFHPDGELIPAKLAEMQASLAEYNT